MMTAGSKNRMCLIALILVTIGAAAILWLLWMRKHHPLPPPPPPSPSDSCVGTVPSAGLYKGNASALGYTVVMQVNLRSDNTFRFILSPPFPIDCDGNTWTFDPATCVLGFVPGACLQKALGDNKVRIDSILYSPHDDTIRISAAYSGLITIPIQVTLSKQSS